MQKSPIQLRSAGSFNAVLAAELMHSERRKGIYISIMSGVTAVMALAVLYLSQSYFEMIGDHHGNRYWILAVPLLLLFYELGCVRILDLKSRRGEKERGRLGLLNALLEPTAVTACLVLEAVFFEPGMMFNSPISYAYPGVILLSALRLSWKFCILSGLVAAVEYLSLAAWHWSTLSEAVQKSPLAFLPVHGMRAALILFSGIAAAFVASEIRKGITRSVQTVEERDFVVGVFGRYLTDEVVDVILRSPEGLRLGGKRETVTLMMTDLRGFSNLSEQLPPESVMAMLNNCLSIMTDVILRHRGTIDELIGDAILTVFGAPLAAEDDAERAVACAIEMQLAMKSVNRWNFQNGLPILEMGIGIHTGQAVVGNIGSEKRSKYGVVGSAVNLTSRIESYTVGGQVLVSAATAEALGPRLRSRGRRTVHPKGFTTPIELFDVEGIDGPSAVELPVRQDHLTPLGTALEVRFVVFEGKDAAGPRHEGRLTQLSEKGALLQTDIALEPLWNLQLELRDAQGQPVAGHLLAKVVDEAEGAFLLRFTAVDQSFVSFFDSLLHR